MSRLRQLLWFGPYRVRRFFGITPIGNVFKLLERRGWALEKMAVLELFGGTGKIHLRHYIERVDSILAWEIDPASAAILQERFPQLECRQVDTYEAIHSESRRFDLIISDNPMREHGGHQEHFDLFPGLTKRAKDNAVLIFSIIPSASSFYRSKFPGILNAEHLKAREEFYGVSNADEIDHEAFYAAFNRHLSDEGYTINWWHIEPRNPLLSYFVCEIGKIPAAT